MLNFYENPKIKKIFSSETRGKKLAFIASPFGTFPKSEAWNQSIQKIYLTFQSQCGPISMSQLLKFIY